MAKQGKQSQTGRLRIVAGKWRSRLLEVADVEGLRPTSARIRETVFNWLESRLYGARCLDLCAGTGALGIEALSRGARDVVFVENSHKAQAVLRRNLASLQANDAVVNGEDARHYLENTSDGKFDIVFMDPPFSTALHDDLCRLLDERQLLSNDARIYIESDRGQAEPNLPAGWQVLKNKTAGNVRYRLAALAK